MPQLNNPSSKGDLFLHFNIILPKNLDNSRKDIIKQVLPQIKRNNQTVLDSDKQEVKNLIEVKDYSGAYQNQNPKNNFNESSSDFEQHNDFFENNNLNFGMGQPPGVQCAQQ